MIFDTRKLKWLGASHFSYIHSHIYPDFPECPEIYIKVAKASLCLVVIGLEHLHFECLWDFHYSGHLRTGSKSCIISLKKVEEKGYLFIFFNGFLLVSVIKWINLSFVFFLEFFKVFWFSWRNPLGFRSCFHYGVTYCKLCCNKPPALEKFYLHELVIWLYCLSLFLILFFLFLGFL